MRPRRSPRDLRIPAGRRAVYPFRRGIRGSATPSGGQRRCVPACPDTTAFADADHTERAGSGAGCGTRPHRIEPPECLAAAGGGTAGRRGGTGPRRGEPALRNLRATTSPRSGCAANLAGRFSGRGCASSRKLTGCRPRLFVPRWWCEGGAGGKEESGGRLKTLEWRERCGARAFDRLVSRPRSRAGLGGCEPSSWFEDQDVLARVRGVALGVGRARG